MKTVLVVEDEACVRKVLVKMLRHHNFEVLEAQNGENALEILAERGGQGVDVILTDIVMPIMSGLEMLEILRQQGVTIPAIILSGFVPTEVGKYRSLVSESFFLQKPPHMRTLVQLIVELTKGKALKANAAWG